MGFIHEFGEGVCQKRLGTNMGCVEGTWNELKVTKYS